MSVTLQQILEFEEGLRLSPYLCPARHWTIGIGWNIEANGLPGWALKDYFDNQGQISKKTAHRLLVDGIKQAREDAAFWVGLTAPNYTEARKRAVENMAFQLGRERLFGFKKTRNYILEGDWYQASRECLDSVWYRGSESEPPQSPERAKRVSRVFETGEDDFYQELI